MKTYFLLAGMVVTAGSLLAAEAPRKSYLVGTKRPAREARLPFLQEEVASRNVRMFESVNGFVADLTAQELTELQGSSEVRFIEPDYERHELSVGGGSVTHGLGARQAIPYGIEAIGARKIWSAGTGRRIKVGVIDTGLDLNHPDLKALYRGGRDFVEGDDLPQDLRGHGTHVAGTIAAIDNGFGVVGVAPDVDLYILRVLDAKGEGSTGNVIRAVDWAIANRLDVINLSLGSANDSFLEEEAFKRAQRAGVIAVAASGNSSEPVTFPAGYRSVIAVGAIDEGLKIASFSNFGPEVALVAPGVGVLSTYPSGTGNVTELLTAAGQELSAEKITWSPDGEVSGEIVFCQVGNPADFPVNVAGRIALIQRGGDLTFGEKAKNAVAAGAIAVIIANNVPGAPSFAFDVDGLDPFRWPLGFGVTQEVGDRLLENVTGSLTMRSTQDDYSRLGGTSMASPHVAGVIALLKSISPAATSTQILDAMTSTARDLGEPGFDVRYGHGLVDARAAAIRLAPEKFYAPPITLRTNRRR